MPNYGNQMNTYFNNNPYGSNPQYNSNGQPVAGNNIRGNAGETGTFQGNISLDANGNAVTRRPRAQADDEYLQNVKRASRSARRGY